jgi:hypothetical protein
MWRFPVHITTAGRLPMAIGLTKKAEDEIEASFDNQREAFRLLKLIDAEFQSDPMSVQCFDLRIVERVRKCVEAREKSVRNNPMYDD